MPISLERSGVIPEESGERGVQAPKCRQPRREVNPMSDDSAAVLRILLAISQKQIDSDIADGERDFDRLIEQSQAAHRAQRKNKDPELTAKYHHLQLVRANLLQQHPNFSEP